MRIYLSWPDPINPLSFTFGCTQRESKSIANYLRNTEEVHMKHRIALVVALLALIRCTSAQEIDPNDDAATSITHSADGYAAETSFPRSAELPAFHVVQLNLANASLAAFPDALCHLRNVQGIDVKNNGLTTLPPCIANFSNTLVNFQAQQNKLTILPSEIGSFSRLRILDLSNNKVEEVPDTIGDLSNLVTLGLSNNQLKNVPFSLSKVTGLVNLNLSRNQISEVPECLPYLINLQELDLSNNLLTEGQKQAIRAIFAGSSVKLTL